MFVPSTKPFPSDIREPRNKFSILSCVLKIFTYTVVNHCVILSVS